jgi:rhodanese-related sulfurtransferase
LEKLLSESGVTKDKEIIVIDMFGSQGLAPAKALAEAGYKVGYMADGMMDWHIARNYPTAY